MDTVGQGGTKTFTATVIDGAGDLVNLTNPIVDILDPDNVVVVDDAVPTNVGVGLYEYTHTAGVADTLGFWTIRWSGEINGVPVELPETFEVVPAGTIGVGGPVDLNALLIPFKNEVSAPGENFLPGATDSMLLEFLRDSFWDAWLDGFYRNYKLSGNRVVPVSGTTELDEGLARMIVVYAGYRAILNKLTNIKTVIRNSVGRGAAETEVQRSAQLLTEILKTRRARLERLRDDFLVSSASKSKSTVRFTNLVLAREAQLVSGVDVWVR